jgi:hypothetical protein
MNDFAFVAIILVFFAVAALFVKACDWIIGGDEEVSVAPSPPISTEPEQQVAA